MDIQFGFQSFSSGSIPPSPTPPDPIPLTYAEVATINKLSYIPAYYNGLSNDGVGATLTATQNGYISDGTAVGKIDYNYIAQVGDIILVKNEVSKLRNGLYQVVDTGSSTTPYQLVRSPENDTSAELYPLQVNVLFGQTQNLRFYIQTTVNPTIGTSNIVFSLSVSSSYTTPLTFVDTATSSALPECTYASGTNAAFPGLGATLTATNVGALGTVNGLSATTNTSLTTGFTKILVKNQVNEAHNGTYLVTSAGNSTTRWKLTRIDYTSGGFNRYIRYFLVSNTGSTLAGKYYFTVPTNPPLTNATIGTANLQILEYGGGAGGYNLIQEEGTSLPARTTIDFQGAGVTATDDGTKTIVTIPGGGSSIVGENYVVVYAGDDWTRNATELQDAYALAQTLTPNGDAISATNRVTVVCYPGYYDFDARAFEVTEDFIDIVSITGNCDVKLRAPGDDVGINITARNDVFIKGIDTQWANQSFFIGVDTISTHIFENCKGGNYSFGYYDVLTAPFDNRYDMGGTFIDCVGGNNSFGSNYSASGTFTNCIAGDNSFGASVPLSGYNTTTTGTFTNCVANDNSFGVNGTCTGRFINCTANTKSFGYTCTEVTGAYFENCKGGDDCFVSSEIPNITIITITGDVINCTANDRSFGYGYGTANCNLNFYECTGNDYCFSVNMKGANEINPDCNNCTANNYSFGYLSNTLPVKYNFRNCLGGNYCFSGYNQELHFNCTAGINSFENSINGQSIGTFVNCRATNDSFGSILSNGNYNNCIAGSNSFGGATGAANGTYYYCTAIQDSFASDITGTLSGKLYWCQMTATTFGTVTVPGRTFYCVGNDTPNNQ